MARAPSRRFGFVKLPGTAKRWRNESTGEEISDRQMAALSRSLRLGGQVISKEAYTKEVESGRRAYADAATAKRQQQARQARELLQDFPGITRAERQAVYAGYRRGQEGGRPLTQREYELLQRATRRVDPDDDPTGRLKQAMGYPTAAAFPFSRVA